MPARTGSVQISTSARTLLDHLHAFTKYWDMLLSADTAILQPDLVKTLFIARAMHQIQAVKRARTFLNEGTST